MQNNLDNIITELDDEEFNCSGEDELNETNEEIEEEINDDKLLDPFEE